MIVEVYIEGQRLDLYQDEGISITQGVQDVKDISKLFADYSQTFTVPASKNNNKIFKHFYNADIDGGFDARTRKLATIDVNTLDFKYGKIQLESVEIKDNVPLNYKITFYGETIKVKDLIGDDKLRVLDFLSNFNHDYNEAQVLAGLQNGLDFTVDGVLYEKAIIYPLISYYRQYLYDSSPDDSTSTDQLVNIHYRDTRSDGIRFDELKPAIRLSLIVESIERRYGLNFTGGFFNSLNYKDIYMPLHNSTDKINAGYLLLERESGINAPESAASDDRLEYRVWITPKAGFENTPYILKLTWNGGVIYEHQTPITGVFADEGRVDSPTNNYEVTAEIITQTDFEFNAVTRFRFTDSAGTVETYFQNTYLDQVINLDAQIVSLLPDIKVYDFLTSIFKMFNLVVFSNGTDIVVEDLQSWYSEGQIYDISKYVDTTKLTVEKGKVFNQINFLFEESDQILANNFFERNNIAYGNIEQKIYQDTEQTVLLDGDTLDIKVLFENPVNERLTNRNTTNNEVINVQYMPYLDSDVKPFVGKPFLIYAETKNTNGNPLGFKGITNYSEIIGTAYMPSQQRRLGITSSFSLNFKNELSEYTNAAMSNNIFSTYYQDYISDIFSVKRRNYRLEAILPDYLLQRIKLNDRLIINGRRYIINKLTSNLVNRKDTFELINDIYDAPLASDTINDGSFRTAGAFYPIQTDTYTIDYIGIDTSAPILVDTGFGTDWITINSVTSGLVRTVTFTLNSNGGAQRTVKIKIGDATFSIAQEGAPISADTTTITTDTTEITADYYE